MHVVLVAGQASSKMQRQHWPIEIHFYGALMRCSMHDAIITFLNFPSGARRGGCYAAAVC